MADLTHRQLVHKWAAKIKDKHEHTDIEEPETEGLINYLDKILYSQYPGVPNFERRLSNWLDNVDNDSDKKILLELVPNLFFVGSKEFDSLYQAAYEECYVQWLLASSQGNKFKCTEDFNDLVEQEMEHTAFTQLTDSMNINQFYHANTLPNKGPGINWYADVQAGQDRINSSMQILENNSYKRVVILEDHIGSGTQLTEVVSNTEELFTSFEVLVIPLLCGKIGNEEGISMAKAHGFSFKPVLVMGKGAYISQDPLEQKLDDFKEVAEIAEKHKHRYLTQSAGSANVLGYRGSGSLLVMHTNCPDNTMPFIHSGSDSWCPLFPRQGGHI